MKRQRTILFVIGLCLIGLTRADAAELVINGGFETGNFSGWTVASTNTWYPWQVTPPGGGDGATGSISTSSPMAGTYDAWTGFCCAATGGSDYIQQDIAIPALQTAHLTWSDKVQSNLHEFCSAATCGTNTWQVQILNTSNVVLQTLYLFSAAYNPSNHNTGWVNHSVSLNAYAGQTIRLRFSGVYASATSGNYNGPGRAEVDRVSIQSPFAVTAAGVSVSGRVVANNGRGIANVTISLSGADGSTLTARTNSFGYYKFDDVNAGETYILAASSKFYRFEDSSRVISVSDQLTNLDFVGLR